MAGLLDAHPHIFSPAWETGLFVRFDEMMNSHLKWALSENKHAMPLDRSDFIAWIRESVWSIMSRFGAIANKERWAEKTPAHVFHMPLIAEVFPESQFIHMIRNGRDVVRSLQNMPWAPRRLRWAISRWHDSVTAGRAFGRTLSVTRYKEVRYEELIAQPQATLEGLCSFLDEPFAEKMLAFHRPENSSWGVEQRPLQDKPVNNYDRLGVLDQLVFWVAARSLQRELGYSP